jgi:hypothetical protein
LSLECGDYGNRQRDQRRCQKDEEKVPEHAGDSACGRTRTVAAPEVVVRITP